MPIPNQPNRLQPHTEVFPDNQKAIWPLLAPLAGSPFVLYGGTAVAVHLGHRFSVDFDFFSAHTFQKEEIFALLPFCGRPPSCRARNSTPTGNRKQAPRHSPS